MRDAIYSNARLTALYDALNQPGEDTNFYLALAGDSPRRILDIGCGTGQLACLLAEAGHTVTGLDPSAAMLAIAKRRPFADRVTWVQGDARTAHIASDFELIVMTGHTFQVLVDDEDIRAVLRSVRAQLQPKGTFAFETRNPAVRSWDHWNRAESFRQVELPQGGMVEVYHEVLHVDDSWVTFETHHHFLDRGDTVSSRSVLKFIEQERLALYLSNSGFTNVRWYGDWDSSPLRRTSEEMIVVAS